MTCITKRRRGEKKENIQIDKNTEKNKQREENKNRNERTQRKANQAAKEKKEQKDRKKNSNKTKDQDSYKTKEGKSIDANTNLTLILTTRKIRFKNNNKKRGYEKMKIKGDLRKEQK